MSKKVLVVGGHPNHMSAYYSPFTLWGDYTGDETILETNPEDVSLVVFTGGEDVDPALYNQKIGRYTGRNVRRDAFELKVFKLAHSLNLPLVGICRGSQFLCVMAGGSLVQDITGHGGNHEMETVDGRTILVSSTHHQMQLPPNNAQIIAWSKKKLSAHYWDGDDKNIQIDKEIEAVYYPNINAVGMQWHPEYMNENSGGFLYCQELVDKFLVKYPEKND